MGMRFIDDSVAALEKGRLVQIFPEAHNTDDGLMHEFKPSYILIALRAGVPIIPVMLDGNYGFNKRAHVIIGKPIRLSEYCSSLNPSREEIVALNEMVQEKAQALLDELHRRIREDQAKKHQKKKRNRKRENA